jgi:hypothetical protein
LPLPFPLYPKTRTVEREFKGGFGGSEKKK